MTTEKKTEEIYGSMDEIVADGTQSVEYATIDGFSPGKKIRIGSVTAGDMIEWSTVGEGTEAKRTAGLRLITKSLVDKDGKRYADDISNIPKLAAMRHSVTERIVKEILKLNGMNVKVEDVKKD